MRRTFCITVFLALLAGFIVIPAYAGDSNTPPPSPFCCSNATSASYDFDESDRTMPPGEVMIFDALVLRPLGIVSMFAGFGGAIVTAPWAASSCSLDRVEKQLLEKPAAYTFSRKIGDVDW